MMHVNGTGLFHSTAWAKHQDFSGHRPLPLPGVGFAFALPIPLFGYTLYIPRGATFSVPRCREIIREAATAERAPWVRVEPTTEAELRTIRTLFPGSLRRSPHEMQPRENLVADIALSDTELLARMKSKTRYNVRLAEKAGVTIRFSREEQDIETLIRLIRETAARKRIAPHPDAYYRNFFSAFESDSAAVAIAEHGGRVLAANLLVFHDGTAFYLHGGSSGEKRELMAPFLLHFSSLREARQRGCRWYDFGGVRVVTKQGERDADWDGITRFKQGFVPAAPTEVFPGTFDIIFSPTRYILYRFLRTLSTCSRQGIRSLRHLLNI
jgi:peptidoglycan pentaglycine glycine transferase (the first glycine)